MSPVVPHFELHEETAASGTHVMNVRGEIHLSTAPRFSQRLQEAIDRGNSLIVLDLTGVEFIDSTGLTVLLNGLRRLTQVHGRMAIVCANPTVLRLFQITRLDETFAIFPERPAAFAYVARPAPGAWDQPAGGSTDGAP